MIGSMALVVFNLIPQPQTIEAAKGDLIPASSPICEAVDGTIAPEGYRLEVNPTGSVTITSSDMAGAFYARQTLEQMRVGTNYSCAVVTDAPQYKLRGMHFDDCRHLFGKDVLKKTLDLMAQYNGMKFGGIEGSGPQQTIMPGNES